MKRAILPNLVLLALAVLLVAPPAAAQEPSRFEITPFVGYRFGGDFTAFDDFDDELFDTGLTIEDDASFGVVADVNLFRNLYLELLFSRQSTELTLDEGFLLPREVLFDIDVDTYHAGVLYQWTPGQVQPFVTATAGVTRFSPDRGGLSSDTQFSIAFGGGVKLKLSDVVGLRFDGRVMSTFVDEDEEIFCGRRYCYSYDDSSYLVQGEITAGLLFAF